MTTHVPKETPDPGLANACLRHGWWQIAVFLFLGLVLESFHLVKLPAYVDIHLRRELWTLAHAHGTLLGALVVLFGSSLSRLDSKAARGRLASRLARAGATAIPCGFFLGALGAAEGDPSLFVLLVPLGALLLLAGIILLLTGLRR